MLIKIVGFHLIFTSKIGHVPALNVELLAATSKLQDTLTKLGTVHCHGWWLKCGGGGGGGATRVLHDCNNGAKFIKP